MKRALLGAFVLAVVCAAGARPAHATDECRGLQICVRVHGPWVVVPSRLGSARAPVQFQLTCPRGFVVAGLDAQLSDRLRVAARPDILRVDGARERRGERALVV